MNAARERAKTQERLIETELSNYAETRRELEHIRRARRKDVSTATILYLERTVHAIDTAIRITEAEPDGENRMKMLKLKYMDKTLTTEGIMLSVPVARTIYYKWKKDFIRLVGSMLGYEV